MASAVTEIAVTFLIFTCIAEGTLSLTIEHKESVNATVGQNISLPCIVSLKHDINIAQMEWKKEGLEEKLVVYHPVFPTYYSMEGTGRLELELVNRTGTSKPLGSILHLYNVSEKESGTYVCDITTFPAGSFIRSTKVHVTEPQLSLKVSPSSRTLIEGDEVNITCSSNPPADGYQLWSPKTDLLLENVEGNFKIHSITRHIKELICQPLWNSSTPHLQNLRGTVQLTVDYLDDIKCNFSNQIEIEMGTNLTISCGTQSSMSIDYVWRKGNITVSHHATINLYSVNSDDSGLYSLMVYAGNHSLLQKQMDFNLTVFSSTYTEHLGSTTPMKTSQINVTTVRMVDPGTTTVTSGPGSVSTLEKKSTVNSTTPSAGNGTTLHANVTATRTGLRSSATASRENSTRAAGCSKKQNATSGPGAACETFATVLTPTTADTSVSSPKTTNTTEKNLATSTPSHAVTSESGRTAVVIFLPLVLVFLLIVFLYRRYLVQKRMDMPPPFKPPPPPVKYTSVRSHDTSMTESLV